MEALTTYVSLSDSGGPGGTETPSVIYPCRRADRPMQLALDVSGLGQEEEVLQRALSALDSAAALALDVLKSYWTPVLENGTGHVARELSRLPIRAWAAAMNRVAQKPRESGAILGNRFRQAWFAGKARVVDLDSQIRQAEVRDNSLGMCRHAPMLTPTGWVLQMEFVRLATCPWGEPVAELDCTRGVPAQLLGKGGLPDEPLLLRGAASSWPAVQLWSLRYLVSLEQQFSGKARSTSS